MVGTCLRAKLGGAFLAFLCLSACEATTAPRPPQVVIPEATAEPAISAAPNESTAESTADTTEEESDVYDDAKVSADKPIAEATAPVAPPVPEVILHYAELRGRVEAQTGKRLTIEPLVVTSSTYPVPGCMANLWIEATNDRGEMDWRHIAEVRVATQLRFGMPVEVDIVENGKDVRPEKLARATVPAGSRVRIQWQW